MTPDLEKLLELEKFLDGHDEFRESVVGPTTAQFVSDRIALIKPLIQELNKYKKSYAEYVDFVDKSEVERLDLQEKIKSLQAENESLREDWKVDIHQLEIARGQVSKYKEALEKIAKPKLGGKEQQWVAQEALKKMGEE